MLIALARFESAEAARQNSDRPEQTAWWQQTAALFTGEPVFHDSTSVEVDTPGDPSRAGFVQVMQARSSDPDRARELMTNDRADWQKFRPGILGTVSVGHDGDAWTMAIYFTSGESAREGEQRETTAADAGDDEADGRAHSSAAGGMSWTARAVVAALLLSGSTAATAGIAAAAQAQIRPAGSGSSATVVQEATRHGFGKIPVTVNGGHSLYEHPRGSCGPGCRSIWPPLLMPAGKTTPKGASCLATAKLGQKHQATYHRSGCTRSPATAGTA